LARKTRSRRLETSISLNGWVTSWASRSRWVLPRCTLRAAYPAWSQTLAERLKGE
jgi:hypothetical protein